MTWEIFLGISALSAFVLSILTVVTKITKVLISVETNLKTLAVSYEKYLEKNEKEHNALSKRIEDTEKKVLIQEMKINNTERMKI